MASLAAGMGALASREQPAPHIEVRAGDVHIAPQEIHNHLPAPQVTVESHVEAVMPEQAAPQVDVHVEAVMPEQAAPQVQVTNEVQPAPIREIAIVALPERETTTTVLRDKAGNLTTTTQREKDA